VAATTQYGLAGAKPFCHFGKARAGRREMGFSECQAIPRRRIAGGAESKPRRSPRNG
jgi:hypothetical protein